MDQGSETGTAATPLRLVRPDESGTASDQQLLDALKIRMTPEQREIRRSRCERQHFVPAGITWRGLLLSDAEDRAIAEDLELLFQTQEIDLPDMAAARLWIVETMLEHPELNGFQRIRLNLQRRALLLETGRQRMSEGGAGLTLLSNPPPHNTRREIAKASGSSEGQVQKVQRLLEAAAPEVIERLEHGKVKIGTAFAALQPVPTRENDRAWDVLLFDPPTGVGAKRLREVPLADLANENAVLFCWAHPRDLVATLSLARRAGFRCITHFVSPVETPLFQDYSAEGHDVLLLCTRGTVPQPAVEDLPSTLLGPTAKGVRPEMVFGMIERLFPHTSRAQVLPRVSRTGWDEWDFTRGTLNGVSHAIT